MASLSPFSTVNASIAVTDTAGTSVTNLASYTLTVTFPDGTTVSPPVSNAGGGLYTATYDTKDVGEVREDWSIAASGGTPKLTARYYYYVSR